MTSAEPMPGSVEAPFISPTAERMWGRLPRVYRLLDARNDWAFKRYLAGIVAPLGEIDEMVDGLLGSRPLGPATPEPVDMEPEDLARWRETRRYVNSSLTDPDLARAEWLPYIAQLLGAYLDPGSGEVERRDVIRGATSGYRGGTAAALADATRSALTGSRYVLVQRATRTDGGPATVWDISIRTRASETPSPELVIPTIIRKGAKPAGVRLWHATFGTSWDKIEALFPTWDDWESRTWDTIEEAGVTYEVPENMAPGPSFEDTGDMAAWTPLAEGGGSVPTWPVDPVAGAGVDGQAAGRLTKVGATGGMRLRTTAAIVDARILPAREYIFAVSVRPSAAVPMTLEIAWQTAAGAAISTTSIDVGTLDADAWNRSTTTTRHTSPATAARAQLSIVFTGTVADAVSVDLDAALFRLITTGGG